MEKRLTSKCNKGEAGDPLTAIKNLRQVLNSLPQPIALVTGTVDLLLMEFNQETNFKEALQAVRKQLKIILQIIDEIWNSISRLVNHDGESNMKTSKLRQRAYNSERSPTPANGGPATRVERPDGVDLVTTGRNIRQRLHALAQPLVVVTGTIDLLLLELERESCHYEKLQTISEQLESIVNIIDEVRKVARNMGEGF
ncbi:MAG: hypothetical protein ACLFUU_02770 [Desulfobacteraceae bacterium]